MSNKYYQKHKEKPWKEALERYQNLSEKKNKKKKKKKKNKKNNNKKKTKTTTTTTKGEKSPQKDTKIWVNNEKKTCQYSWM